MLDRNGLRIGIESFKLGIVDCQKPGDGGSNGYGLGGRSMDGLLSGSPVVVSKVGF